MPKEMIGHRMYLGYNIDDDGEHLRCECGADIPLGFNVSVGDAAIAERTHILEALDKEIALEGRG